MRKTLPAAFVAFLLTIQSAIAAAPPHDPSVSAMRAVIDRYAEDRGALSRSYDDRFDPARRERMGRFLDERMKELEAVDFDKLDQAGKVDYLLLRNDLRFERKQLAHRQKELDEAAALLPFAAKIVELEQARRQVQEMDAPRSAKALTEISRQVADVRKALEAKQKSAGSKDQLPSP